MLRDLIVVVGCITPCVVSLIVGGSNSVSGGLGLLGLLTIYSVLTD